MRYGDFLIKDKGWSKVISETVGSGMHARELKRKGEKLHSQGLTPIPLNAVYSWPTRSSLTNIYNDATNAAKVAKIQGYLDGIATNIASQLDTTVIRIPVAYTLEIDMEEEDEGDCRTHLPNSVNAAVANMGGTVKVGIPDPRFHPFREVIASRLNFLSTNASWVISDEIHFVKGEAHCATGFDKEAPTTP